MRGSQNSVGEGVIFCVLSYFYVIGAVLKAFGVNKIGLHSFKNFDVYVDRE